MNPSYLTSLSEVAELSANEQACLAEVATQYPFRVNRSYLSLIDWDDPADPIRRIVIPDPAELDDIGSLDPSSEHLYRRVDGLEHKYEHVALLLVSAECGGYCRFCFRKRLFLDSREVVPDVTEGLEYIRQHPAINNVLLSGGDPLMLGTDHLAEILDRLRAIPHVRIIRIGTKMPLYNPRRILDDSGLTASLERYSMPNRRIFFMIHTNHPRELTSDATAAIDCVKRAGVTVLNQTPLIKGVNDDSEILADLFDELTFRGVMPYYVFQCRPTRGNAFLSVPVEKAFQVFDQARMRVSGLGKNARFVMSHKVGKIEVLCLKRDTIHFRVHRSADPSHKARIMVFKRNPDARWFDDYSKAVTIYQPSNPFIPSSEVDDIISMY